MIGVAYFVNRLQRLLCKGLGFQALEIGLISIKLEMPKLVSKEALFQLKED